MKNLYYVGGIISIIISTFILHFGVVMAVDTTCTDLTYDISKGFSDTTYNKSVTNLQNYLYKMGYFNSTPNGYFGPATQLAVKKYQTAKSIPSTGVVGPLTRKSIKNISCNTSSAINSASVGDSYYSTKVLVSPSPKVNVGSVVNIKNITVTSPNSNSILVSDTPYVVRWSNYPNIIYDILLEDKNGVGFGYVSSSVTGDNYEWKVGKVYSASTNSYINLTPGTYRIHLRNTGSPSSAPDQYSELFTVLGKPVVINSIIPSTLNNKENVSVVIYGSGFDNTSLVHFNINGRDRVFNPNYVSIDGKILVFTTYSGINPAQYSIVVNNAYTDGATSTPSSSFDIVVTD